MSKKTLSFRLKYLIVIHRGLSCVDESATDIEQSEKILYFYPNNISLSEQLGKITMLEGLIDFSSKFSLDPIESCVLDNLTWSFYQCEPDIWIIMANQNILKENFQKYVSHHQNSVYCGQQSLKNIYEMLYLFSGPIHQNIVGKNEIGLKTIDQIKRLRKKIRKLDISIGQLDSDITYLRGEGANPNGSDLVYFKDKNLEGISSEKEGKFNEREKLVNELDDLLDSPYYLVKFFRSDLSKYLNWQIDFLVFEHHSAFTQTYRSIQYIENASLASNLLFQLKEVLADATHNLSKGFAYFHNQQLVWSDFDNRSTQLLSQFLHMKEFERLYTAISYQSETLISKGQQNDATSEPITVQMKDSILNISKEIGVIKKDWMTLYLDQSNMAGYLSGAIGLMNQQEEVSENFFSQQSTYFDIPCPLIHLDGPSGTTTSDPLIPGRLLFCRFYNSLIVVLLEDWSQEYFGPCFEVEAVDRFLQTESNFSQYDARSFVEWLHKDKVTSGFDLELDISVCTSKSKLVRKDFHSFYDISDPEDLYKSKLGHACFIALCASLQCRLSTFMRPLERKLRQIVEMNHTNRDPIMVLNMGSRSLQDSEKMQKASFYGDDISVGANRKSFNRLNEKKNISSSKGVVTIKKQRSLSPMMFQQKKKEADDARPSLAIHPPEKRFSLVTSHLPSHKKASSIYAPLALHASLKLVLFDLNYHSVQMAGLVPDAFNPFRLVSASARARFYESLMSEEEDSHHPTGGRLDPQIQIKLRSIISQFLKNKIKKSHTLISSYIDGEVDASLLQSFNEIYEKLSDVSRGEYWIRTASSHNKKNFMVMGVKRHDHMLLLAMEVSASLVTLFDTLKQVLRYLEIH